MKSKCSITAVTHARLTSCSFDSLKFIQTVEETFRNKSIMTVVTVAEAIVEECEYVESAQDPPPVALKPVSSSSSDAHQVKDPSCNFKLFHCLVYESLFLTSS